MRTSTFIILIVLSAVLLDLFYWAVIRNRWTQIRIEVQGYLEKKFHVKFKPPPPQRPPGKLNLHKLFPVIEITLILAFALWVGRAYLNFDENVWPTGFEFGTSVRTHFNWIKFRECGLCFLWDGSIKGGAPSFVDLRGSWLHPLVAASTLIFGFINGTKIVLLDCLFLAGLAQWWMAKLLKVGVLPRLYAASMAVVAGNLAASMNMGDLGRVISHVSAVLALAGGFQFARDCNKRNAVIFSSLITLLIISGQGYNQAGFFLALFPSLVVLINADAWKEKITLKNFLLTGSFIIFLTGFFLVPLFHFLPHFFKDIDLDFNSVQPIQYIPVNLIIDNYDYYSPEILGMLPYPSLYSIYLGWIPILLALSSLIFLRKESWRIYTFFGLSMILVLLASSGLSFRALTLISELAYGFRHSSVISGLLVPLILGLSSLGLHGLLNLTFLNPTIRLPKIFGNKVIKVNLAIVILLAPLVLSIRSAYFFGHPWFSTARFPESESSFWENVELDHTEWIKTPFGLHFLVIPLLENDLKVGEAFRDWIWKDRIDPPPFLEIDDQRNMIYNAKNEYASIFSNGKNIICTAHANGGYINVHCPSSSGGILTVMENYWPGWKAWVDGKPAGLDKNQQWLTLETEPGEHDYLFRYLPLDVLLGSILTLVGIGIAAYAFFKK